MALTIVARYVMQTRQRFPKDARERRWRTHQAFLVVAEHCATTTDGRNDDILKRATRYAQDYALGNPGTDVRVVHRRDSL